MLISEIHCPQELSRLMELLRKNPSALIVAGSTGLSAVSGARSLELPATVIDIGRIPELERILLTERFLEIGAAVTLGELAEYNPAPIHPCLLEAIHDVATQPVCNLATIGGNIAAQGRFMTLWSALACLDSLLELRSPGVSRWVNINRMADESGTPAFPRGTILCRIRIPLERWDLHIYKRIGGRGYPGPKDATLTVTARLGKNIVNDFHLVFAGERSFRSRDLESAIVGRKLPFAADEIRLLGDEYRQQFAEIAAEGAATLGRLPELALSALAG